MRFSSIASLTIGFQSFLPNVRSFYYSLLAVLESKFVLTFVEDKSCSIRSFRAEGRVQTIYFDLRYN